MIGTRTTSSIPPKRDAAEEPHGRSRDQDENDNAAVGCGERSTALDQPVHREEDPSNEIGAAIQAGRALDLTVQATISAQDERGYLPPDVAELAWSILLAAHAAGLEEGKIVTAASGLIEALELRHRGTLAHIDEGFMIAFGVGLQILAGIDESDVQAWVRSIENSADALSGIYDWGLRIDSLGRAPSANRNQVTAPPAVIDAINRLAIQRWPRLATLEGDLGNDDGADDTDSEPDAP